LVRAKTLEVIPQEYASGAMGLPTALRLAATVFLFGALGVG
jgi:hypothetical protein